MYKPGLYDMIGRNIQGSFLEDDSANVWFATYEGVNVHLPSVDSIHSFQINIEEEVISKNYRTIGLHGDTLVVQADQFTVLYDIYKSKVLAEFKTRLSDHYAFSSVHNGDAIVIYAAGYEDLIEIIISQDLDNFKTKKLLQRIIRSIHLKEGYLWIGTFNEGLFRYDLNSNTLDKVYETNNVVTTIFTYQDGIGFNVSDEGTYKLFSDDSSILCISNSSTSKNYTAGFVDHNQVLWEGVQNEGSTFYDLQKLKFKLFDFEHPISFIDTSQQNIILGLLNSHYAIVEKSSLKDNDLMISAESNNSNVQKIAVLDERVYTYTDGLRLFNSKNAQLSNSFFKVEDQRYLSNLIAWNHQLLLIPNGKNVYTYNPLGNTLDTFIHSEEPITNGFVYDHHLYLSHDDVELRVYNLKSDIHFATIFPNVKGEILSIQPSEKQGCLYACTTAGLYSLNLDSSVSKLILDSQNTLSTTVYSAYVHNDTSIWCSTNVGIIEYNPRTNHAYTFKIADGVQDNEFNRYAHLQLEDGTLLMGGTNGLNIFHPDSIKRSEKHAPVILTEYKINDTKSNVYGVPLYLDNLDLTYEENTISFFFHAIDYGDPDATRVKYKLEGEDKNYVESSSSDGEVRYGNLDPGEYTLSLIGANSDGVWNKKDKRIQISIAPPFWLTWWFLIGSAIIIGSLIFSIIRYYYNQQLIRKDFILREQALIIEKQNALQAERTRIAHEMHDDLGGGLTSIRFLSQRLLRKTNDGKIKELLDKIVNHSQSLVNNLSEIIWAMNSGYDTLDNLIAFSRRYAFEYLEPYSIDLKFNVYGDPSEIELSGEKRRNVFLIIKESLHNVVKHSGSHHCVIEFYIGENLILKVKDFGKGLIENDNQFNNGLKSMNIRANNLKGEIEFVNEQGLEVVLSIPLDRESSL